MMRAPTTHGTPRPTTQRGMEGGWCVMTQRYERIRPPPIFYKNIAFSITTYSIPLSTWYNGLVNT